MCLYREREREEMHIPEWSSTVSKLEQVRPVPSDLCCLLIHGKYGTDKWLKKERQKSLFGTL